MGWTWLFQCQTSTTCAHTGEYAEMSQLLASVCHSSQPLWPLGYSEMLFSSSAIFMEVTRKLPFFFTRAPRHADCVAFVILGMLLNCLLLGSSEPVLIYRTYIDFWEQCPPPGLVLIINMCCAMVMRHVLALKATPKALLVVDWRKLGVQAVCAAGKRVCPLAVFNLLLINVLLCWVHWWHHLWQQDGANPKISIVLYI